MLLIVYPEIPLTTFVVKEVPPGKDIPASHSPAAMFASFQHMLNMCIYSFVRIIPKCFILEEQL